MKLRFLAPMALACVLVSGAAYSAQYGIPSTLVDANGNPINGGNPLAVNASVSASISGFTPSTGAPTSVTAPSGSASAATSLPTGASVMIDNEASVPIAFGFGGTSVTALGTPVPAGCWKAFTVPSGVTQFTVFGIGGTGTVIVTGGAGLAAGGCGGSGGGSGSNASVGSTGSAVPGSATLAGMSVAGNLTAVPGTANGLKVDGSGVTQPVSGTVSISGTVPVSGTFFQGTQPVSAAANIPVSQVTASSLNATVVQPTATSLNATVVNAAGSAIIGKVGIDQTTPGTTNGVQIVGNSGSITQGTVSCGTSTTTLLAAAAAANFVYVRVPTGAANAAWVNWAGSSATTAAPSEDIQPGNFKTWSIQGGYLPTSAFSCIATAAVSVVLEYK